MITDAAARARAPACCGSGSRPCSASIPAGADLSRARPNASLGLAEIEFLRRLNQALPRPRSPTGSTCGTSRRRSRTGRWPPGPRGGAPGAARRAGRLGQGAGRDPHRRPAGSPATTSSATSTSCARRQVTGPGGQPGGPDGRADARRRGAGRGGPGGQPVPARSTRRPGRSRAAAAGWPGGSRPPPRPRPGSSGRCASSAAATAAVRRLRILAWRAMETVPDAGTHPRWPASPRVTAVVVTYNRRDLLLEALAAVHAQSRAPDTVIVVDNASDRRHRRGGARQVPGGAPGRAEPQHRRRGRVRLRHGAGPGRRRGPDLADGRRHRAGARRAARAARGPRPASGGQPPVLLRQPGAVDRRARAPDEHPAGQAVRQPRPSGSPPRPWAACRSVRRRSCRSWWTRRTCRRRGLPQADYFLWNDDFEFTTRLLRGNSGLLCPASVVVHKTRDVRRDRRRPGPAVLLRGPEQDLDAQDPCAARPAGAPGLRRARRCAAGRARSPAPATAARSARRWSGASRPGVRTSPRPTAEVLADVGLKVPAAARTDVRPSRRRVRPAASFVPYGSCAVSRCRAAQPVPG